jgi:recombination protein RecA
MKIGLVFGNPETTTGGNALKFYSSVRLDVRKTDTIDMGKDTDAIGNRIKVKVVKNKVAPPFRRAEMEILFGKGISATGSLLDAAVKHEIIDKKGAWYSYGEEKIGQGRDSARDFIEQNPDTARDIELKLRKVMFPGRTFPALEKPAVKPTASEKAPVTEKSPTSEKMEVAEKPPAEYKAQGDVHADSAKPGRPKKAAPEKSDDLF